MKKCTNLSLAVAVRLKQLREEAGLSHQKLSKRLEDELGVTISKDSLINYEVSTQHHSTSGKNLGMRLEYLHALATFYDVSADYILGFTDTRSRSENIKIACDSTGLNESVLLRLIGWNNAEKDLKQFNIPAKIISEIDEHKSWMAILDHHDVIDFANRLLSAYLENPRWITRRYESYLAYLEAWHSIVSTQGEHPVYIAADDYSAELLDKGLVAISADLAAANCLSSAMSLLETSIDDNAKSDIGIVCD